MTGWHLDDDMLRRYVERTDSLAEGASAEQHLLACEPCRARVNTAASATPAFSKTAATPPRVRRRLTSRRIAIPHSHAATSPSPRKPRGLCHTATKVS